MAEDTREKKNSPSQVVDVAAMVAEWGEKNIIYTNGDKGLASALADGSSELQSQAGLDAPLSTALKEGSSFTAYSGPRRPNSKATRGPKVGAKATMPNRETGSERE